MKIKVINSSLNHLPEYETSGSSGLDLRAANIEPIIIKAHGRELIPTGLKVAIPEGYECQIRPRSGLALKQGITVLNTPGTIDASYRGEIGVILMNTTDDRFEVHHGDRIAQAVFTKVEQVEWEEVQELDSTERGEGGFGHTGIK